MFERFPLIKFGWDTHHGTVTMHMPVEAADVIARAHPDPYRIESAVFELEKAMRDNWWPDVNVEADLDDNR